MSETYPLGAAQQLYADMCRYDFRYRTINTLRRLRGPLDAERWCRAVADVVRAHDPLRMRLDRSGPVPRQRFDAAVPAVTVLDRAGAAFDDVVAEAWARSREELDVERDGPLRVVLARLGDDDHLLAITEHDITSDGWSSGLLATAFLHAYEHGAAAGPDAPPYREHVLAEEAGGVRLPAAQLAWWRDVLAEGSSIPVDPARRAHRGVLHRLDLGLGAEATAALRGFGGRARATPFATVLAGVAVACWAEWRHPDFRVTTALAGRGPATEGVIGLFSQLVDLRMQPDAGTPCGEFVRSAFAQTRRAVRESATPYGYTRMLTELAAEGSTTADEALRRVVTGEGGRALTIAFEFLLPPADLRGAGLRVEPVDVSGLTDTLPYCAYDVVVAVGMGEQGTYIGLFHNPEVVDRSQALRLGERLVAVLTRLGPAPVQTPLGELVAPDETGT